MENRLRYQYGKPSKLLAKSFELQNFDIVNAERKQHGLKTLDYSKDVFILRVSIVLTWLSIIILTM